MMASPSLPLDLWKIIAQSVRAYQTKNQGYHKRSQYIQVQQESDRKITNPSMGKF